AHHEILQVDLEASAFRIEHAIPAAAFARVHLQCLELDGAAAHPQAARVHAQIRRSGEKLIAETHEALGELTLARGVRKPQESRYHDDHDDESRDGKPPQPRPPGRARLALAAVRLRCIASSSEHLSRPAPGSDNSSSPVRGSLLRTRPDSDDIPGR